MMLRLRRAWQSSRNASAVGTNTQQKRKIYNSSLKGWKRSALTNLCVAKVSLQAENKTSFMSCQT